MYDMIHILFLYTPVSYQIANVFQFFLFTGHINPEQVFVSWEFYYTICESHLLH
jgi:hypothetical protein